MQTLSLRLPATSHDVDVLFRCDAPRVKRGLFALELRGDVQVTETPGGLEYDCVDQTMGLVPMNVLDQIPESLPRPFDTGGTAVTLPKLVRFFAQRGFTSASSATVVHFTTSQGDRQSPQEQHPRAIQSG